MIYLIIASVIWAFSFGLIKTQLTTLDSDLVAFIRLLISLFIFLPLLRIKNLPAKFILKLICTGLIQYGLMYMTYIASFKYLPAYQVALFTIFTPLYVCIIYDILEKRFNRRFLFAAVLAVTGTAILVYKDLNISAALAGIGLLQISNLSFAFGQVYYTRIMKNEKQQADYQIFGLLYLGAVLVTGISSGITVNWSEISISSNQWLALIYLGVLPSGICFFLWNAGARKTSAGNLAVMNNAKIPLAIFVSVIFFNESAAWPKLIMGILLFMAALYIAHTYSLKPYSKNAQS